MALVAATHRQRRHDHDPPRDARGPRQRGGGGEALRRQPVAAADQPRRRRGHEGRHARRGRPGTATRLQIPGYEVGGKTGTAQLGTDPPASHTWIIGFAGPPGDPQIAIAVVVLNQPGFGSEATGGRVAAPIAKQVMAGLPGQPRRRQRPATDAVGSTVFGSRRGERLLRNGLTVLAAAVAWATWRGSWPGRGRATDGLAYLRGGLVYTLAAMTYDTVMWIAVDDQGGYHPSAHAAADASSTSTSRTSSPIWARWRSWTASRTTVPAAAPPGPTGDPAPPPHPHRRLRIRLRRGRPDPLRRGPG